MKYDKVQDSGKRTKFETGSQRDDRIGKGRYDLLPTRAIHRLAKHFENGAIKYEARNWEKGQPTHVYMDSAMRHLFEALQGMDNEDHLSACAWNVLCLIETRERIELGILPKELETLP